MNTSVLPFGTQIASEVLDASVNDTPEVIDLETVGDLLDRLATNPPRSFVSVRRTHVDSYRFLAAHAVGVSCGSLWMDKLASPGRTAAR